MSSRLLSAAAGPPHGRIPLVDARRYVLDRRDLLTQADLSRTVGVQHYRDGFAEHAGGRRAGTDGAFARETGAAYRRDLDG